MKSLKEFILEQTVQEENEETKEFTFDFTDIDNGEEIAKSFAEKEGVSVDGSKVTITVQKGTECDNCKEMKSKIDEIRKQQKNHSDESYAQKTKKLEDLMKEVSEFTKPAEDKSNEEE